MTGRRDLIEDMEYCTTILSALDGIGEEISDKAVIKAMARGWWHILEYLIGRNKL